LPCTHLLFAYLPVNIARPLPARNPLLTLTLAYSAPNHTRARLTPPRTSPAIPPPRNRFRYRVLWLIGRHLPDSAVRGYQHQRYDWDLGQSWKVAGGRRARRDDRHGGTSPAFTTTLSGR
jgi:hypothetical protein